MVAEAVGICVSNVGESRFWMTAASLFPARRRGLKLSKKFFLLLIDFNGGFPENRLID
jgi:hypothetical protein